MRRSKTLLLIWIAGLALVAGCARTRGDDAIATDIKAQMFSDAQLKDSNLQVAVNKGEVTLTGVAASDAARYEAYKLASQAKGVSKVIDQMTLQPAQAAQVAPTAPAPEPAPAPAHRKHVMKPRPADTEDTVPAVPAAPLATNLTPAAPPQPVVPPSPPPPQPKQVTIPEGATVSVRMIDGVDSSINHVGESFHASLETPLVSGDQVVVPKGADVTVRLVQASSAGHYTGKSDLRLELVRLDYQGKSYPLESTTYDVEGSSRGKRTAAAVGGGAALGALIGAIAGGGKGAAIGAGVGAGSGGVYQGVTKGKQIRIPSETKIDFRLEQPVTISYMPHSADSSAPASSIQQ